MDKKIPIYFDNVIVTSPIEKLSDTDTNIGRLKVGVFTKYGNRNGSYITDAVADMLIQGVLQYRNTPVVGFFDPETKTWAGHTGPTLANSYGYVEDFIGWQPFADTDGETRDYAVFSVILFTEYFDEATMIAGQHQSMELNINSIDGDWADINGIEYFVYTKARIQGLCIIGSHEPCFSVSTFFSKDDDNYNSQYDKFSSLLSDLKARVEEAENGGEKTMDELQNNEVVVETPETEPVVEPAIEEPAVEPATVFEEEPTEEAAAEPSEFEVLKQQYDELLAKYENLSSELEQANSRIAELDEIRVVAEQDLEALRATETSLRATIEKYELQAQEEEKAHKETLIQKYEKEIEEPEEIDKLRGEVNNFSYEELEGKLAILFANKKMNNAQEDKKIFVPEQESQFALLMQKYRK